MKLPESYLREVFAEIELVEEHFKQCCAFQMNRCLRNQEYEGLWLILESVGMPESVTPCDRAYFEAWLVEQGA